MAHIASLPSSAPSAPARPRTGLTLSPAEAAFIGARAEAFAARWAEMERRGWSWNWAAFALGGCWMAYRRMFPQCGVLLLVGSLVFALLEAAAAPAWIEGLVMLLFATGIGLIADRLYRKHVCAMAGEIGASGRCPISICSTAMREGGTSPCAALCYAGVLLVLRVSLALLLDGASALS